MFSAGGSSKVFDLIKVIRDMEWRYKEIGKNSKYNFKARSKEKKKERKKERKKKKENGQKYCSGGFYQKQIFQEKQENARLLFWRWEGYEEYS